MSHQFDLGGRQPHSNFRSSTNWLMIAREVSPLFRNSPHSYRNGYPFGLPIILGLAEISNLPDTPRGEGGLENGAIREIPAPANRPTYGSEAGRGFLAGLA